MEDFVLHGGRLRVSQWSKCPKVAGLFGHDRVRPRIGIARVLDQRLIVRRAEVDPLGNCRNLVRRQLATAQEGIRAAERSYERNLERIQHVQGLPLEALQSIQALAQARREYLRVVVGYDEAQFRLQRALGWPVDPVADGG